MKLVSKCRWGEFRYTLKGSQCVYCGDNANSEEHFPPKSFCRIGVLLPCCKECNSLAGTMHPQNFERRIEYVKNRLRKRHRSKMNVGYFTVDEIEEFNGNLKRSVNLWQNQRRLVHERIAWNVMAYIASIDKNKDFARICADLNGTTNSEL